MPLFKKLALFGIVGVLATITHIVLSLFLVSNDYLAPFNANAVGYITGFVVAYCGHYRYSFNSSAAHHKSMPRFLVVSGTGLFLNQIIVYLVVNLNGGNYSTALIIILLTVPAVTYVMGRYWAFSA